jgi:hypothetical protein
LFSNTKLKLIHLNSFIFLALTHQFGNNSITIRNSIVIGDITQDCSDVPDTTTLSEVYGFKVIPAVSSTSSPGDNEIPFHPFTGIESYPASKLIKI